MKNEIDDAGRISALIEESLRISDMIIQDLNRPIDVGEQSDTKDSRLKRLHRVIRAIELVVRYKRIFREIIAIQRRDGIRPGGYEIITPPGFWKIGYQDQNKGDTVRPEGIHYPGFWKSWKNKD